LTRLVKITDILVKITALSIPKSIYPSKLPNEGVAFSIMSGHIWMTRGLNYLPIIKQLAKNQWRGDRKPSVF
jgi:lipoprotein signal peptidase